MLKVKIIINVQNLAYPQHCLMDIYQLTTKFWSIFYMPKVLTKKTNQVLLLEL